METIIKIPKSKKYLRIKHLKALKECVFSEVPTLQEKAIFLHDLTETPLYELRKLKPKEIERLYVISTMSFSGFKLNDNPPKVITLDGIDFEMVDPHKAPSGWHIDFANTDGEKDPVRLACLYYFPKGEKYGEVDDNENLIHPIKDRYELFKEEFPLQVFLECNAFFLKRYERSLRLQVARLQGEKVGMKIRERVRRLFGRKPSTP